MAGGRVRRRYVQYSLPLPPPSWAGGGGGRPAEQPPPEMDGWTDLLGWAGLGWIGGGIPPLVAAMGMLLAPFRRPECAPKIMSEFFFLRFLSRRWRTGKGKDFSGDRWKNKSGFNDGAWETDLICWALTNGNPQGSEAVQRNDPEE